MNRSSCASGSGLRALVLNRVLSREHGKNRRQAMQLSIDRYLPFFHRFQQRCLCLGRRAIDLVGQQQVGKIGPGRRLKVEVATLKTFVPVISDGIKSGVNWMRPKFALMMRESVFDR